ncbi:MAG: Gfo/Idh/MocA family oxidoreductase [Chitinophagaceae bacterium]|nr:Gfo/Idh/MocA family oxidoreductase [Chitinophagaceae bacterium]
MLKVGVIGAGYLGKIHIQQWKTISDIELIGFFDIDKNRAAEIEAEMQLKSFETAEELIEKCDALDIVSSTSTHFYYAQKAIKHSKNLFIEKPMAANITDAKSIVEMVNEAQVKCQIGHIERFNPAFTAIKDKNIHPLFIEGHRLAKFNPRGNDVSVILDLMIHDIDIILSLVKSDIKRIAASGVNVISETSDIANVRLEFANGCVANLTASRISLKNMRKLRMFQKDAYISVDFLEKKTEIVTIEEANGEIGIMDFPIELPDGKKKIIHLDFPEIENNNAIKMELELFRDSILNNTTTSVMAEDGYLAMDIAYQILEKIEGKN